MFSAAFAGTIWYGKTTSLPSCLAKANNLVWLPKSRKGRIGRLFFPRRVAKISNLVSNSYYFSIAL